MERRLTFRDASCKTVTCSLLLWHPVNFKVLPTVCYNVPAQSPYSCNKPLLTIRVLRGYTFKVKLHAETWLAYSKIAFVTTSCTHWAYSTLTHSCGPTNIGMTTIYSHVYTMSVTLSYNLISWSSSVPTEDRRTLRRHDIYSFSIIEIIHTHSRASLYDWGHFNCAHKQVGWKFWAKLNIVRLIST